MAESTDDSTQKTDITDEQLEAAMSETLAEQKNESSDDGESQEPTEKNAEPEEGFRFDKEKFQKQNRELANLKRTLSSLTDELKSLKDTRTSRQQDKVDDLKDEAADQIDRLIEEGHVTPELAKVLKTMRQPKSDDQLLKKLEVLEREQTALKWERAFYSQFPNLPTGSYQKLSERAVEQAREDVEAYGGSDQEVATLANGYLIRMARVLSKKQPATTKVDPQVIDKTARSKPSGSTKGADIARKGAAPSVKPNDMSDEQLDQEVAKILEAQGQA